MTAIFGVPVDAAYHLVFALTSVLTPVLGGLAAVAGIILLTMAVRLLVLPLSFRAMRAQAVQAKLAPKSQALRAKYAKHPERLQRELTALYKREGTSMFASLWPVLLQWPALSVMYLLFRSAQVSGQPNKLLGHDLLGVPLGMHWLGGAGAVSVQGLVFLGVFALLAVFCWLSARLARALLPAPSAGGGGAGALGTLLPYLIVLIAAFAPLAAAVYLVASTAWSVIERRLFRWRETRRPPQAGPPAAPSR
jgi:YidC/Oxa1 family membrane protein insertase